MTATRIWGTGLPNSTATLDGISYVGVVALNLTMGSRPDAVYVEGTAGGTSTNISTGGGAGPDSIDVNSIASNPTGSGGVISTVVGPLVVKGQSSTVTLTIDDSGDTNNRSGTLTATGLTGLGMGNGNSGIAYTGIAILNIFLGSGGATFNVQGTHPVTVTTVTTQAGSQPNIVNVSSPTSLVGLAGIAGVLNLVGQGSHNTANAYDNGDPDLAVGTLTSTALTGLFMAGQINYQGIQALNVTLGQGGDKFTVISTSAGTTTTINGGGGPDGFAVKTISGLTIINGGTGTNIVNVGSNATPASDTGGNLDSISALLVVNGNTNASIAPVGGGNILNVDDTGETQIETGQLTSTQITGLGMSVGITYATISTLNIDLGQGTNGFTVNSTSTRRQRMWSVGQASRRSP